MIYYFTILISFKIICTNCTKHNILIQQNQYVQIIHIFYDKSDKVICTNCTNFVHFVHTQKHVFFFTTMFFAVTKYITSFHCSSCSYRTIPSFHISLSAMIWLVQLECFQLCFPICLQSIPFFEIDTFTHDPSTLFPFSIYFLLFIKQQNTMVEIRNNIVQKRFGKNFIHAIILKRRR